MFPSCSLLQATVARLCLGQAQVPKDVPLIPHAEKRQGAVPKGMPKFVFPFLEYQCSMIIKSLKQLIK